ncbi:hypothetical protein [Sphingobacterium paludis]|uniref:Uncharacterized protein n=1 Tax=Sphingobacterium paludis TaxID=1476465 RepID=A0A4R7D261_9SPHI|nr:hypothetical protein [Sphingobacterium paludis]TDS14850.1 hypothetical protein B0I21_103350 [Sphingobacterium paludis]
MAKNDKKNNRKQALKTIRLDELKAFGITQDPQVGNGIEEIDGEKLAGGRNDNSGTSLCQNWPTVGSLGGD